MTSPPAIVELLTVMDCFQLSNIGLAVLPDFPVPKDWKNCSDSVIVFHPDGPKFEVLAQFNAAHFRISDSSAPARRRWRIVVSFPALKKEDVPPGSKIMVSTKVWDAICGNAPQTTDD